MYGVWSESLLISEPAVFIHNKEQGKGGEMEGGSWGGGEGESHAGGSDPLKCREEWLKGVRRQLFAYLLYINSAENVYCTYIKTEHCWLKHGIFLTTKSSFQ